MSFAPHIHEGPPRETATRSLVKTIIYRVFSAADTMFLAWLIMGPLSPMLGGTVNAVFVFGIVDLTWNTVFYYINERVWARIDLHRNGKAAAAALLAQQGEIK